MSADRWYERLPRQVRRDLDRARKAGYEVTRTNDGAHLKLIAPDGKVTICGAVRKLGVQRKPLLAIRSELARRSVP